MTRLHRNRLCPSLTLAVGLLAGLALPQRVAAGGWLSLRNDTPHVLLVADSGGPNARHGKTQRLYPGESIVDIQAGNGPRTLIISDARAPQRVLAQTTISPQGRRDDQPVDPTDPADPVARGEPTRPPRAAAGAARRRRPNQPRQPTLTASRRHRRGGSTGGTLSKSATFDQLTGQANRY
jgi:hypothetical protein